jgi:invasion protein IalB
MANAVRDLAMAVTGLVLLLFEPSQAATKNRLAQSLPAQQTAPSPNPVTKTEIVNFENWSVTCREFANPKKKVCSAALEVFQTNPRQMIFKWTMGVGNDNKPIAVFDTPTGILLVPGVDIKFDKGAARKATYVSCMPGFCNASMPVDGALVRDMMASAEATVTIETADGRKLNFKIPLKGFDKAYAALR